jgi:hypothetical protein
LRMRIATLSLLTILCLALSAPAFADINLYTNGPTNGNNDAYFIDVYQVSDSFTVTSPSSMNDFTIALWAPIGETPLGVAWEVGTSSFGSQVGSSNGNYTSVPWSSLTMLPCPPNCGGGFGYSVWDATITGLPDFPLAPGTTYYLTLTGATDSSGGRDGWDINSGSSLAYHNLLGQVPSESFTITGTQGSTPEPSSIMLFGSGILGLAGVLRRKLTR